MSLMPICPRAVTAKSSSLRKEGATPPNSTMSRFAGKLIKRYGSTEKAFQILMEEAGRCYPPLSDDEPGKVWASAQRFAKKVQGQPGYVPPEKYQTDTTL